MSTYRLSNNTTARYTSFEDAAKAFGCKPVVKKTSDAGKLKSQQEKFVARHRCKGCGEPMTWIGGNTMTCTNEKCKGVKIEKVNKDGEKYCEYITSYDLLDELGETIAINIFS